MCVTSIEIERTEQVMSLICLKLRTSRFQCAQRPSIQKDTSVDTELRGLAKNFKESLQLFYTVLKNSNEPEREALQMIIVRENARFNVHTRACN